jgi:hypothetical protein
MSRATPCSRASAGCLWRSSRRLHGWLPKALAQAKGAHVNHTPLYRRFPDGVPNDTLALWIQRMLVHYLQREGLPCITCGGVGSTHVLRPCHHVVCERCFDITATTGCPVCGTKLIEGSRFFTADEAPRPLSPNERWIKLQVLHPSAEEPAARALLERLCARAQAMSPDDVAALKLLVAEKGLTLLAWLPEQIPVKENLAIVLGGLLDGAPQRPGGARPAQRAAQDGDGRAAGDRCALRRGREPAGQDQACARQEGGSALGLKDPSEPARRGHPHGLFSAVCRRQDGPPPTPGAAGPAQRLARGHPR